MADGSTLQIAENAFEICDDVESLVRSFKGRPR
jgi:hypothetical protein